MDPRIVAILGAVLIGALVLGWNITPAQAQSAQQVPCGARHKVVQALDDHYSEKASSMGLASNGNVVEVLTSTKGSWTIIMTQPSGVTCMVAAGEHWENVPGPFAGAGL